MRVVTHTALLAVIGIVLAVPDARVNMLTARRLAAVQKKTLTLDVVTRQQALECSTTSDCKFELV